MTTGRINQVAFTSPMVSRPFTGGRQRIDPTFPQQLNEGRDVWVSPVLSDSVVSSSPLSH